MSDRQDIRSQRAGRGLAAPQPPRSRELYAATVLLAASLAIPQAIPSWWPRLLQAFVESLRGTPGLWHLAMMGIVPLVAIWLVSVTAACLQRRATWHPEALKGPRAGGRGLSGVFDVGHWAQTTWAVLATVGILVGGGAAYWRTKELLFFGPHDGTWSLSTGDLASAAPPDQSLHARCRMAGKWLSRGVATAAAIGGMLGLLDFSLRSWRFRRAQQLSPEAWREALRRLEGNQGVRRLQRQRQRRQAAASS